MQPALEQAVFRLGQLRGMAAAGGPYSGLQLDPQALAEMERLLCASLVETEYRKAEATEVGAGFQGLPHQHDWQARVT